MRNYLMRNKLNLFGIIVILAAIGLSTIACSKDDDEETYYVRYADLTLMRYNDAATTVTISGTTP